MNLKNLEIKKLVNDIKYWKIEVSLKNDMSKQIEIEFNNSLNSFLENNLQIKKRWNSFLDQKEKLVAELLKQQNDDNNIIVKDKVDNSIKMKKLYRNLVKILHPDKLLTDNEKDKFEKEELYKKLTQCYEQGDIINLIYYADELKIEIELTNTDIEKLNKEIQLLKSKSFMIEKSFHWQWYIENKNEDMLSSYLFEQISFK